MVLPRIHTYALYCATDSPKRIEWNEFPPETIMFLLLASKTILLNLSSVVKTGKIRLAMHEIDVAGRILQVVIKSDVLSVYGRRFLEKGSQTADGRKTQWS